MRPWFIRKANWLERLILRKAFVKDKKWYSCEQGFIDQHGVFMNRQEAYLVADAAGQVRYGPDYSKGVLYSEDLY